MIQKFNIQSTTSNRLNHLSNEVPASLNFKVLSLYFFMHEYLTKQACFEVYLSNKTF